MSEHCQNCNEEIDIIRRYNEHERFKEINDKLAVAKKKKSNVLNVINPNRQTKKETMRKLGITGKELRKRLKKARQYVRESGQA